MHHLAAKARTWVVIDRQNHAGIFGPTNAVRTTPYIATNERILGGLWGSLVGDALGVPVEFQDRASVQLDPVRDMRGFGTHAQPRGTWSDDGSLLLCTADSLVNHEFSLADMGARFVRWMNDGLWTAHGAVFDMG